MAVRKKQSNPLLWESKLVPFLRAVEIPSQNFLMDILPEECKKKTNVQICSQRYCFLTARIFLKSGATPVNFKLTVLVINEASGTVPLSRVLRICQIVRLLGAKSLEPDHSV